jgi:outer membrane receptor protein involved in Fe transport
LTRSSGAIVTISTPKQNVAQENLGAVLLDLSYKLDAGIIGQFELDGSFVDVMSHNQQKFAGDPIINLLDSPFYSTEFKTKDNLALTWTRDSLGATVYLERYGKTPNYIAINNITQYATPGAGDVDALFLANASVNYRPLPKVELSLAVNNLFNTGPPADHSTPGTQNMPYNTNNYNVYGRTYFLTASYGMSERSGSSAPGAPAS